MSTVWASALWKQNQTRQHWFWAGESSSAVSQTEHLQGGLIPDDGSLPPATLSRWGFTVFVWGSTCKDFSFRLPTALHFLDTSLRCESSYVSARACCEIRARPEWLSNTIFPPQVLTFKSGILIDILRELETHLHLLCKMKCNFHEFSCVPICEGSVSMFPAWEMSEEDYEFRSLPQYPGDLIFTVVERELPFPLCGCR